MAVSTPPRVSAVRVRPNDELGGVSNPSPSVSWQSVAPAGWQQAAAEIRLQRGQSEETYRVLGTEQLSIAWPFRPLLPREHVEISLRVEGSDGSSSNWSEPTAVWGGFLAPGEWTAKFIQVPTPAKAASPALFRKEFAVTSPVASATLYSTARGVYDATVNGKAVDELLLKPGWTSYHDRILYSATDVTSLIRPGENALGLTLAGGWFTEQASWALPGRFYGDHPQAAAQLVIESEDGTTTTLTTDDSWSCTDEGPLRESGLYDGEHFDARRVIAGWDYPGFNDSDWLAPHCEESTIAPAPMTSGGVVRYESLSAVDTFTTPSGRIILDFGQNLVGRLRITVAAERGTTITLRHSEVLEDGELCIRPLRGARATDQYTCSGLGTETWEPQFTFHGFRYAELDGWPEGASLDGVVAVVIHSEMRRTGWFECSDSQLNRLHDNVLWSMRGNFLSVPSDCPQRDERMGWTGDIQVFSPTAAFLYDCDAFLSSWLTDLWLEQRAAGGIVPSIVPDVLNSAVSPRAAWGDAATVVPWTLYQRFGNTEILRAQFPSMIAWVEALREASDDDLLWEGQVQFGDWLDPSAPPQRPADGRTNPDIVSTAHFFRSLTIVASAAEVLGLTDEARTYSALAQSCRESFLHAYQTPAGRMLSDTPTAYAMAIVFEILESPEAVKRAGERLSNLVRRSGYRISTGFVGTPIIQDALTLSGQHETAERLLFQTHNPSWLYPVSMGATTIWERWDSLLEDGSVNPGKMTSFNHYALGAVADWMHRTVAGLGPAAPAYKVLSVAPQPLAGLEQACARHETPYGLAEVGWRRTGANIEVSASVPTGTTAEVLLPGASETFVVESGDHRWSVADCNYPAPARTGASATAGSVVQDSQAYDAVKAALESHGAPLSEAFVARTQWLENSVLANEFHRTPHVAADVRRALESLQRERDARSQHRKVDKD